MSPEAVSVIVPTLNEEAYIEDCLGSLLRQEGCNIAEVIVVDGGSSDRTIPLVRRLMSVHPQLKLMHNPERLQGSGINLAVHDAEPQSQVILRADAHTSYAPDFTKCCVEALRANDATSVVVSMLTVGKSGFQRAVAAAQNSVMGNGGSVHRLGHRPSGFVDHGHHAAFDRSFFHYLSGYDVTFHPNDDYELDYRAGLAGGRIWLTMDAKVIYFPRDNPVSLARQYYRYGRARALTHMVHRMRPRLRQMLPPFLLLTVIGGFALSTVWWGFAVPPLLYLAMCLFVGCVLAIKARDPWLVAAGPAAVLMHLSFGVGFLRTMLAKSVLLLRHR